MTKLHQVIQILLASMGIPQSQSWSLTIASAHTFYFIQWETTYRTLQRAKSSVGTRYMMFPIRYRAVPNAELSSTNPVGGSFMSEFNIGWGSLTKETVHELESCDKGRDLLLWQFSYIRLMTKAQYTLTALSWGTASFTPNDGAAFWFSLVCLGPS